MKISKWNRLKSYFVDVHLEGTSSDCNEILDVLVSRGRYQLCTVNAIYSFDDLYDNYAKSFRILLEEGKSWNEILVLGLGLGSIPSMLERKFNQRPLFTAVEIDEEVVRLAHKYVLHELRSPVEVYTTDAMAFVDVHEAKYDLICVDLFVDDIIPNKFQTVKFLKKVGELLNEDGLIMYNRLARTSRDLENSTEFFNSVFKVAYPEARYLDVGGNWMLLSH